MTEQLRPPTPALTREEENFYRAMHYSAGAALVLGVADEAMAAIRQVVEQALRQRDKRNAAT